MDAELRRAAEAAKGFMPRAEGLALYEAGVAAGHLGPLVEIGSYCGKSAIYLGAAALETQTTLFSIDHHRGSEENQPGWEHHDPATIDARTGRMDTLPLFRRTIEEAGLEGVVVAIVADSLVVAEHWTTPLALVFVDGAHSEEPAMADVNAWATKLLEGGLLAIHDVFADPADGGQGPYRAYRAALESGRFRERAAVGSLRILERI